MDEWLNVLQVTALPSLRATLNQIKSNQILDNSQSLLFSLLVGA
jgi:hypothetical protein